MYMEVKTRQSISNKTKSSIKPLKIKNKNDFKKIWHIPLHLKLKVTSLCHDNAIIVIFPSRKI